MLSYMLYKISRFLHLFEGKKSKSLERYLGLLRFFRTLLPIDLSDMTIPKKKDDLSSSGLSKNPDDTMNKTFIWKGILIAFAIATHHFPRDKKNPPLKDSLLQTEINSCNAGRRGP